MDAPWAPRRAIPRWYIVHIVLCLSVRNSSSSSAHARSSSRRPTPSPRANSFSVRCSSRLLHSRAAILLSATLPSHSYPSHQHTNTNTMPGLVNDVTRIWEQNIFWPVNAQCGVWDPKLKGVDIWECVRARECPFRSGSRVPIADYPSFPADHSTPSTQVCTTPSRVPELPSPTITCPTCVVLDADRCPLTQPPNSQFWRYVTRR